MHTAAMIFLVALVTQARAGEPAMNRLAAPPLVDRSVSHRIIDILFDRRLMWSHLRQADLHNLTLAQTNHLETRTSRKSDMFARSELANPARASIITSVSSTQPLLRGSLLTVGGRQRGVKSQAVNTARSSRRDAVLFWNVMILPFQAAANPLPGSADYQQSGTLAIMEGQYANTMARDTNTGLLFQEVRLGEGDAVVSGERVLVDWACYTVHRGFNVQAKMLAKGGAFAGDEVNLIRFSLDDGTVIGAINEAIKGMRKGGIRRIVVVPGDLYYPNVKGSKDKQTFTAGVGPVPSTFSGQRALDQVLTNPGLIDKSLVFDVELLERNEFGAVKRAPGTMVPRSGVTTNRQWDTLGGKRQAGGLYQGD